MAAAGRPLKGAAFFVNLKACSLKKEGKDEVPQGGKRGKGR